MQRKSEYAISLITSLLSGKNTDGFSSKEDLLILIAKDFIKYTNKFYRGLEISSNINEVVIYPTVKKQETTKSEIGSHPRNITGMTLSNYFAYKIESNPDRKNSNDLKLNLIESTSKVKDENNSNLKAIDCTTIINKNLYLWTYTKEVEICYGPMSSWYAYLLLREIKNFPMSNQEVPFRNILMQDSEDDVFYNPNFFYEVLCRVYSPYHLLYMNSLALDSWRKKQKENPTDEKPVYNEYEIIAAVIKKVTTEFLIKSCKEKYFIEEEVFDINKVTFRNPKNRPGRALLRQKKFRNRYDNSNEKRIKIKVKTFGLSAKQIRRSTRNKN